MHPLSKHELVSATIKTCTCIGVISGPLVGYKSVIPPLIVQYPFTDTPTLVLRALLSRVCKSGYSTLRGDITITYIP